MGERLDQIVRTSAARAADQVAVLCEGRSLTFAELAGRIDRVGAALRATTRPGDRIAILSWNTLEFVELLYGVPAAGRIAVPLNARLSPVELRLQLEEAGVALVFADPSLRSLVEGRAASVIEWGQAYERWLDAAAAEASPIDGRNAGDDSEAAWLIFTSGTTGRAKGAVLTHRSLVAVVSTVQQARPVLAHDIYLYPFPLFHVSAHNILVQHRFARPVVLVRSFDAAQVLDACRRHGVTTTSLAPTMIAMLLDHPDFDPVALATVRCIGYGAAAIPLALLKRVLATLDVDLSHSYGMTEASGGLAYLSPDDHRRAARTDPHLLRSTGKVVEGVEVRIVDDAMHSLPVGDVGEIAVRAPQVMAGYWGQPELTAQTIVGGWLRTGDLGHFDEEGYLYVVDRKKDIIITGGENVSSREVEDALGSHPAVRQVAVVGVPNPSWGESVCAFVVLASATTPSELIEHCRLNLAGFKRPRQIIFVDELTVNANGKVDKRALRERALEHTKNIGEAPTT